VADHRRKARMETLLADGLGGGVACALWQALARPRTKLRSIPDLAASRRDGDPKWPDDFRRRLPAPASLFEIEGTIPIFHNQWQRRAGDGCGSRTSATPS